MKKIILLTSICLFVFGCVNVNVEESSSGNTPSPISVEIFGSIEGGKTFKIIENDTIYNVDLNKTNFTWYEDLSSDSVYIVVDSCNTKSE